jgi:hypothetical protein
LTIIIPGNSCSEYALSNWPATGFTRNGGKQWLDQLEPRLVAELISATRVVPLEPRQYNVHLEPRLNIADPNGTLIGG